MGRPNSEPELFLKILGRLEWSCLVCLVGYGQEINRGEGGLRLWGEALAREAANGNRRRVLAAPPAIEGGPGVTGDGLINGLGEVDLEIVREPKLHLANSMRAYRNPLHGKWVEEVLTGDANAARRIAGKLVDPPALLTRDLDAAKAWLRQRRRGGRSVGLLTSSGRSPCWRRNPAGSAVERTRGDRPLVPEAVHGFSERRGARDSFERVWLPGPRTRLRRALLGWRSDLAS